MESVLGARGLTGGNVEWICSGGQVLGPADGHVRTSPLPKSCLWEKQSYMNERLNPSLTSRLQVQCFFPLKHGRENTCPRARYIETILIITLILHLI